MCGFEKSLLFEEDQIAQVSLAAGVLRNSLGALADSVLGQFSWKGETDSGLDFPRSNGRFLVVVRETRGFASDLTKEIIHE